MCKLKSPGSRITEVRQDVIYSRFPEYVEYACRYWIDHLSQISDDKRHKVGLYKNGEIHNCLWTYFLHWLEAMSLLGKMPEYIKLIAKLSLLYTESKPLPKAINKH